MKKVLLLFTVVVLLVSCRVAFPENVLGNIEENPFLKAVNLAPNDYDGAAFSFLFITDVHVNREKHDGDKITRFDDNFFSFLDGGNYRFVVSGGDISDDGEVSKALFAFKKKFADRSKVLLEAVGNHDRHTYNYRSMHLAEYVQNGVLELGTNSRTYREYLASEGGFSTGRYVYGDILSIYVLDSSMRTHSAKQLNYLEEALSKDTTKYRIVISHDNIVTGGVLDQSLFMTGYADLAEVTRYIKILEKGNVSLVLSGHHHKGNILYGGDGSSYMEFNGAAYHRSSSFLESTGWWYSVEIDTANNNLILKGYDAETKEERLSYTIPLKAN